MTKIRVSAKSIPILRYIDAHVRQCDIRGPVSRFCDVAGDPLDGLAMRRELTDLIRRRLLYVVEYGFDDSLGRDPNRDRNQDMCGVGWSVNPSERLIRALWPDRIVAS